MPQTTLPSGITIEYESMGDPAGPAMLWIMGFTAQMTAWHDDFMRMFVDDGFHVVRFDNRDCGLSSKLDGIMAETDKVTAAVMMGETPPPFPTPSPTWRQTRPACSTPSGWSARTSSEPRWAA